MTSVICSECKKGSLIEKTGDYETTYFDRNGRSQALVVPDVTWLECKNCGDMTLNDRAMSVIEAARRRASGLLTPEEIRAFRARLNKTQSAMSTLLGIGEKTYCRWESGSYVQSEAFDRYLRLIMSDESNIVKLQQLAKGSIRPVTHDTTAELQRVFSSIRDIDAVVGRSQPFVDRFTRGELQVA
jgi:putative zinc finger/helix-turn-helix YgiT family protein